MDQLEQAKLIFICWLQIQQVTHLQNRTHSGQVNDAGEHTVNHNTATNTDHTKSQRSGELSQIQLKEFTENSQSIRPSDKI